MLVLTRKPRQQIMIGDNIVINIVEVQGVKIYRGEIYRAIQEENQRAAAPQMIDLEALPTRSS